MNEWLDMFAKDSNVSKKLQEADLSENEVSDVANSVAVNVLVSMLDDSKLEKNITASSISKDAVIEFLRQTNELTTDSLLTEDTFQGYQEWLALLDLQNSSGRQLKALLEKYSFALETPESKSVSDVAVETSCLKNPLEHRLAVSHTGRHLLFKAKAYLDQAEPLNASPRPKSYVDCYGPELMQLVAEKDRHMIDRFAYQFSGPG